MNRETTLMEPELPQLKQMVLRNTERIDRHEMMLDEMRRVNDDHSQKLREHDGWAENSRRERDAWMRSMRQTLDEIAQMSKEGQKSNQELREMFKETDRQIKETQKHIDETSMEVKRLSRQLSGTTGNIVEGLLSSSVEEIFKEAGLELESSGKNFKRKLKAENIAMEVDVMLGNADTVVPIEVKTNFTKEDVHWFLHQMGLFRRLFPECSDKDVVAAVAAINYEDGADKLARDEGLLVIRVSSEDVFSLDPFDENALRKF